MIAPKRLSLVLFSVLLSTFPLSAHNFKLINPNTSEKGFTYLLYGDSSLMNTGTTIVLSIDFSKAQIVDFDKDFNVVKNHGSIDDFNRERGQEYVDSWEEDLHYLEERVSAHLNMVFASDCEVADHIGNPKYKMVIRLGQFDFGRKLPVVMKEGGMAAKGLIEIYQISSGKLIAVFDINYVRGKNIVYGHIDRIREFSICFAKGIKKPMKPTKPEKSAKDSKI